MEALRKIEKEITIRAPWGKIAALAWGSPSSPPVLLCHGKLDVCSAFRPLVSLLPSCFYYVSIDLPGNGKSDHLPAGVRYSVADLVPSLLCTVRHFNWDKFIYIGHSLGVPVGKIFNIAYPGYITRTVELDPVPAHHTWPSTRQGLYEWYHQYYAYYDDDKYAKHNGGVETAPKYTYEKCSQSVKENIVRKPSCILVAAMGLQPATYLWNSNFCKMWAEQLVMSSRNLPKQAAEHVLERCLVPAEDNLYRFTFDQRMKEVTILPFSSESLRQIYTTTVTPTFCVLAKNILDAGIYSQVSFLTDEDAWPNKNYRIKIVEGDHDVHISNPMYMSDDVARFLMEDIQAKL